MACKYRIILVLDGGPDALLIPVIGLNHLAEKSIYFKNGPDFLSWIDVSIASGDGALLAALIAQNHAILADQVVEIERIAGQEKTSFSLEMVQRLFPPELQLQQLKKHFSFVSYDVEQDEPYLFSSVKPTIQQTLLYDVLKACTGDPLANQFMKLHHRKLANASYFVPTPIAYAARMAHCLYQDDALIFVSIGNQANQEAPFIEKQHEQFKADLKKYPNWHYFRFAPNVPENGSYEAKLEAIRAYFNDQVYPIDRLLRLMELKAGRIL